jgi:hypothetical protein
MGHGQNVQARGVKKGVYIVDRVILENLCGGVDLKNNLWYIPNAVSQ